MSSIIKCYSQLITLPSFRQRFLYLKLDGAVGRQTFGFDRWMNQMFYRSTEWDSIRSGIITRDLGCDLALDGHEIHDKIYIHHMNPITQRDIEMYSDMLIDPQYLVCTSFATHNAVHYGDTKYPDNILLTERKPNDMCPWRR